MFLGSVLLPPARLLPVDCDRPLPSLFLVMLVFGRTLFEKFLTYWIEFCFMLRLP